MGAILVGEGFSDRLLGEVILYGGTTAWNAVAFGLRLSRLKA
jgi:hypothetical protein